MATFLRGDQDVRPPRVGDATDRHHHPRRRTRRTTRSSKEHARLFRRAIALGQIARLARCGHVFPRMRAAAGPREHVVDRVGVVAAVLASVIVASEDRSS